MPYIKDSWCWSVQSLETEDTNNLLRFKDRCREQTRNLYQMIITVCEQELIDAIQRSIMLWEHRFHAVNEVLRHRSREGDRISRVSKGSFVVGDRVRLTDDAQDPCVEFGTITGGKCEEGWGVNNYTVHWDGFSTPIYVRCEKLVLALTCAVCHPDEANPKVKYCRKCRPVGVNRSSELNNMVANSGCDRCSCGNKYWRDDTCIDCGTKHTDIDWKVNLWGLNPDTDVWEWVDICKWTTQKWAFLDGYKETYDVLEWRREAKGDEWEKSPAGDHVIYVLNDGETWSGQGGSEVHCTDEEYRRISEGGEKVRNVIPDWDDREFCIPAKPTKGGE